MVTKLPHYTLPAFPFLALFFARRWTQAGLNPRLPLRLTGGIGVLLALIALAGMPWALSAGATPSPVGMLVREAGAVLTPDTSFALVDFKEPNAIWEMRGVVDGYGETIPEEQTTTFLNSPGPRAVVLSTAAWKRVRAEADPSCGTFEATGFNAARVGWIDLTLVVKR